ncbi:LysR family transcriptional regulator [Vibrio sp. TRT 1302]|uniref:LysR family transcriptional regulator n=1 Tax=Vibrio sp. TRT 1302 TaxID=3418504 RepID=UPI003CEF5D25
MNLRQLEIFYAVMKCGTISAAAKQLHVSQPNVTRVLAHTEQQQGFALFERVKGRLVPTREAQLLLPEAEKIYQQLGQFRNLTKRIKAGDKHLSIGATPILSSAMLAPIIADICKCSDYSIEMSTGNQDELCDALLKHQLDLAVCFGNDTPASLIQQTLLTTEMVAIMPLQQPKQESVSLDYLLGESMPLIALYSRDPLGLQLSQAIHALVPEYHPQVTVRNYSAAAELVAQGLGCAVVDPWTARQYQHRVHSVSLNPTIEISVSLLYAEHSPMSIAAKWFVEQLKQSL